MLKQKTFKAFKNVKLKLPDPVQLHKESYDKLLHEDLKKSFENAFPLSDYTESKYTIKFNGIKIGKPNMSVKDAKYTVKTYSAPIKVNFELENKILKTKKRQELYFGDIPLMTQNGTFVINGVERLIISQIIRSFGVFFQARLVKGLRLFTSKVIPARGSWFEFESEPDGKIYVKIDKKKKILATTLLRVMGVKTDKEIVNAFQGTDAKENIEKMLDSDENDTVEKAYEDVYKKVKDTRVATPDVIKKTVDYIFSEDTLDISEIGRSRLSAAQNKKYTSLTKKTINSDDVIYIIKEIVQRNNDPRSRQDDIDHLGNRRIRLIGELFLDVKLRSSFARMKRNIQDRMSTADVYTTMLPNEILNYRVFQAMINDFFVNNQLSQLQEQENILSEINHTTLISAQGPGGIVKDRAGFEVRDIHSSQYGRICPVNTPEGSAIGINLHYALYAKVNRFGIIETPYFKVTNGVVTKEVEYLDSVVEETKKITHARVNTNDAGKITDEYCEVRQFGEIQTIPANQVEYVDVATNQILSLSASLVPFLENDDPKRSLMGAKMLGQSVPLVRTEAPLVATGLEEEVARLTRRVVVAEESGKVEYVDSKTIEVKGENGKTKKYILDKFENTNKSSINRQRAIVKLGEKVKKGNIIADSSSTDNGQLAVGKNLRVAFMCWEGANFEDAIVLSKKLVEEDVLSSVHVETLSIDVNDTKLGPEITTYDIPNISEKRLANLDTDGVIRIGSNVDSGDIVVGKLTPQSESQLTAEERLLQSIFGDKAKDMKNTSLKVPEGKKGRIIDIKVFDRDKGDQLQPGVIKKIYVTIASLRSIQEGDKLAGRHGNKGVISKILPREDMPYTEDGNPVDAIMTPLGVPSRMNLGQIYEINIGLAAKEQGYQAVVPAFAGATEEEVKVELKNAGFSEDGKQVVYDGRTGEKILQDVSVGYMYVLKLDHMVEDKIHARSTGQYSLISQQPLGGRAREGGQRFGEMEVWALLAYGSAYTLREMLTIKSDDILGRTAAYDSIIKNVPITQMNTPESFNVLLFYLRGLGLNISFEEEN